MPDYPERPVLLVDDEQTVLHLFKQALRSEGFSNVTMCSDSREVLPLIETLECTAVVLDLLMPHVSGEEVLRALVERHPEIPVIVVTGMNDVRVAVDCMQRGAFDYMVKPVEENRLCTSVRRAVEMRELRRENRRLRDELVAVADSEERLAPFSPIITAHPRMRSLFQYIAAIAPSAQPVLITGETGTGKELFARAVHEASERTGEFVAVNVAGLDDTFFSDALFGHARGAYTGAHEARQGFVEEAAEGTLFLDEIGDLSQASQVKLLRLLQNNEYTPLGSSTQRRSRARVVAATHRNLEQARDEGRLRADLYYRLNTHRVDVPPLRERREDIPILLSHFMETASKALGKPKPSYPPELVDLLFVHEFPGNVRELESMVFDAVGRHQGGVLSLEAIRERTGTGAEPRQRPRRWAETLTPEDFPTIQEATEHLISEAMRLANDNQAIAASLLGISRPALNRRLRHPSARAADARERVEAEDV